MKSNESIGIRTLCDGDAVDTLKTFVGCALFLFSLAVRFLLKIELVNTAFAVFMLFALGLYWMMAWVKQRSPHRS
jgi:hypothetical protein